MGCFLATTLNYAICNPSFAIKREMKYLFVRKYERSEALSPLGGERGERSLIFFLHFALN
jgi:hypothetical protein